MHGAYNLCQIIKESRQLVGKYMTFFSDPKKNDKEIELLARFLY